MQRVPPAVGLLAVAALVSSVRGAAVEATDDFGPAGRRDRPGLARPVPQDASPEYPDVCSAGRQTVATCVIIRNQTSAARFTRTSTYVEPPHEFYRQPPTSLDPGESGSWLTNITMGPNENSPDTARVDYAVDIGDFHTGFQVGYTTIRFGTGTAGVDPTRSDRSPAPYCNIETQHISYGDPVLILRTITFTDTGGGVRLHCYAVLEEPAGEPTPSVGPAAPTPAGP